MTDPQSAKDAAAAAGERAAEQLQQARARQTRVVRVDRRARWLLSQNHFGELLEQALGVQP